MRWHSQIKDDGYRWWFAVIPFRLSDGPNITWVWWEWYQWRFDGQCNVIRLVPKPPAIS